MLRSISDKELLSRTDQLRRVERETTVAILRHLNEIERRQLYLELGYSSMFSYCVGHLRYSESAAGRRVQVARCLLQYPEIALFLERGEVTIVTVSQIAGALTKPTANELLEKIRGRTQAEVEAIASMFRPPVKLRDRVQHVTVPAVSSSVLSFAEEVGRPAISPTNSHCGSETTPSTETHSHCGSANSLSAVRAVPKVYVQFLADETFMEKYREACALLSGRLSRLSFEAVFTELLDEFIDRHDPKARQARREQRDAKRQEAVPGKPPLRTSSRAPIQARTRDAVFARDGGQCAYVGGVGRRCCATRNLHIDHIVPLARGGTNDVSNLRLLCARHNQLEADRILGRDVMDRKRLRNRANGRPIPRDAGMTDRYSISASGPASGISSPKMPFSP